MPDGSGFRGPQWEDEPKRPNMRRIWLVSGPARRPWWGGIADFILSRVFSDESLFIVVPDPSGRRVSKAQMRFRFNWRHPMAVPFCLLLLILSPLIITWIIVVNTLALGETVIKRWRAFRKGPQNG